MPSFDALEPLAPDACRSDPSAPCFYWHLKLHALNGGRDKLSQRELEFVGVGVTRPLQAGWRSPSGLYMDEFDHEVDPVLKQALAMLGQSGLEFLG